MIINHIFNSGNECEFYAPDDIHDGVQQTRVTWNRRPSRKDEREFRQHFYPDVVIPAVEVLMRKSRGPGRMVQVLPGVWAWMDAGSQN